MAATEDIVCPSNRYLISIVVILYESQQASEFEAPLREKITNSLHHLHFDTKVVFDSTSDCSVMAQTTTKGLDLDPVVAMPLVFQDSVLCC